MVSAHLIVASLSAFVAGSTANTLLKGFNYGAFWSNDQGHQSHYKLEADFVREFNLAKSIPGGFNSARLFTCRQNASELPIEAFSAAVKTNTSLLLGFWVSDPKGHEGENFGHELVAFNKALDTYKDDLIKLIVGISVGNEDIYRASKECLQGCEANADQNLVFQYISHLRENIAKSPYAEKLKNIPIGHVDTGSAWPTVDENFIDAIDFLGATAYPYWHKDPIENGNSSLFMTLGQLESKAKGKPVWITETGWPSKDNRPGATGAMGPAVASVDNMQRYWTEVGCGLFKKYNTYWFQLETDSDDHLEWGLFDAGKPQPKIRNLVCPGDDVAPGTSTTPLSVSATPQPSNSAGSSSTPLYLNTTSAIQHTSDPALTSTVLSLVNPSSSAAPSYSMPSSSAAPSYGMPSSAAPSSQPSIGSPHPSSSVGGTLTVVSTSSQPTRGPSASPSGAQPPCACAAPGPKGLCGFVWSGGNNTCGGGPPTTPDSSPSPYDHTGQATETYGTLQSSHSGVPTASASAATTASTASPATDTSIGSPSQAGTIEGSPASAESAYETPTDPASATPSSPGSSQAPTGPAAPASPTTATCPGTVTVTANTTATITIHPSDATSPATPSAPSDTVSKVPASAGSTTIITVYSTTVVYNTKTVATKFVTAGGSGAGIAMMPV